MVKTVAMEFKWQPDYIASLYLDDIDFFGLEYWYNSIVEVSNINKE